MRCFVRCVCLILVLVTCLAIPVAAVEEISPYASNFFGYQTAYLCEISGTQFQVWFNVTAVDEMTELGVSYIDIERSSDGENWKVVKTYDKADYSNLVARNTGNHSSYVTYSSASSSYEYRAYVKFYAKNSSGTGYYGYYAYF